MKQYNHLEIEKKWSDKVMQKYLQQIEQQIIPKELEFEFQNLDELSNYPQDDQILIREYGYDIINLYHLFSKPSVFCNWDDGGLDGVDRFVRRLYTHLQEAIMNPGTENEEWIPIINRLNYRIHNAIKQKKRTIVVSSFMMFLQELVAAKKIGNLDLKNLEEVLKLLAPFAPFLALELWDNMGNNQKLLEEPFPVMRQCQIEENCWIPIQVNGRTRKRMQIHTEMTEDEIIKMAQHQLGDKSELMNAKVISVQGKIVNFITRFH